MKGKLFFSLAWVILVGAIGCGAPQPPLPCSDEPLPLSYPATQIPDFTLEYCEELGLVCNEAVTLADECPAFVSDLMQYFEEVLIPILVEKLRYLPWQIDVERLLGYLFTRLQGACAHTEILDQIGTCQLPGDVSAPCDENADCLEGLVCMYGYCSTLDPI